MKISFSILFSIFISFIGWGQNKIVGYQYAFNDGVNLTYVPITPTTDFHLQTDIDVSGLTHTINQIHIRFKDENGLWSGIVNQMFIKNLQSVGAQDLKIVGYEYYFNNDTTNRHYTPVNPQDDFNLVSDIDVSNLTNTINQIHFRFQDSNGQWSSVINEMFIKNIQSVGAQNLNIVGYEYYFNDDTTNRHYTPVNPQDDFNLITDLDVSNLTNTVNQVHFQFQDSNGQWSSVINQMFIKNIQTGAPQDLKIVGYEYYFNDDTSNRHYTAVNPQDDFNLVSNIDVSSLTNTINQIHFRFKDSSGQWSSIVNQMFIKNIQTGGAQDLKIVAYEYYFNNDTTNLHYTPVNPQDDYNLVSDIDISQLNHSLNQIHFRFKDSNGQWSSIVNQMFIINPESDAIANNKMIAYEYWVDDDMNSMKSISVQPNVVDLNVIDLDLNHIWRGQHVLHSRYLDTNGLYSLVTTDTIMKASRPLARFTTSATEICEGESIQFDDNNSVDYDTYVWDFGDGTSATGLHETHTYPNPGTFTVSLTVTDTNTNISNVMQQNITVNELPDDTISMTGNNPACFGDIVTLSANASGMNYLWSNGATTQSIDVTTAGTYSVQITHPVTGCTINSTDTNISFMPEINNDISFDSNTNTLHAAQSNATYQWLDCDQNNTPIAGATAQDFVPAQSGNYAVSLTANNCTITSDCMAVTIVGMGNEFVRNNVKVYPNPVKNVLTVDHKIPIEISIIDVNGVVYCVLKDDAQTRAIDFSAYKAGVYFVRVKVLSGKNGNADSVFKIIK